MITYACHCGETLRVIETPVSHRYQCRVHGRVQEILKARRARR